MTTLPRLRLTFIAHYSGARFWLADKNSLELYLSFPVCGHFGTLLSVLLFGPVQFSTSISPAAHMEASLQPQYGPPLEPLGFSLGHGTESLRHMDLKSCTNEQGDYLHGSQFSPSWNSLTNSAGSSTTIDSSTQEDEECLVDSQPICFKENPFLVANRKGKGRPSGEQILSGPPVGYGKQGQLQPWLYSKASSLAECGLVAAWRVWAQAFGVWLTSKGSIVYIKAFWRIAHT